MKKYLVTTVSALSLLAATAFSAQAGKVGTVTYASTTVDWTTTIGSSWSMSSTPGTGVIKLSGNSLDPLSVKSPVIKITNNGLSSKFALLPAAANLHSDKDYWIFGTSLVVKPNRLISKDGGYVYDTTVKQGETVNIDFNSNIAGNKIEAGKQSIKVELRAYTE